jgi:hypothetical protein
MKSKISSLVACLVFITLSLGFCPEVLAGEEGHRAVVRNYSGPGAVELFESLAQHTEELEELMSSVEGFVSYTLVRTAKGGYAVTICETQAGIDESVLKAKKWVEANAADTGVRPPEVISGDVLIHCD